jgi:hypothetical protein
LSAVGFARVSVLNTLSFIGIETFPSSRRPVYYRHSVYKMIENQQQDFMRKNYASFKNINKDSELNLLMMSAKGECKIFRH